MRATYLMAGLFAASLSSAASAGVIFSQDFETDTNGWFDADNGWTGQIDREASGTGGLTSFDGAFHARVTQSNTEGVGLSAPYSNFAGVNDGTPFLEPVSVRTAIYLDTEMAAGEGFDYSSALNPIGAGFLQDFIFHVSKDSSQNQLLVGGSNNTNFDPRQDLENLNSYAVSTSGWYIFEHAFRNDGGALVGDLNLYDAGENLLFTESRTATSYTFADVGDVRYSWFTNVDVSGGIAIDGFSLNEGGTVPVPATLGLLAIGLLGLRLRRQR